MSSTNEIFYSQVNKSLQNELNARGRAGFTRNNAALDYMLTKVGNVEITAFKDQEYKTELYTLGGSEVLTDPYVAGKRTGFLSTPTWTVIDQAGNGTSAVDNSFRIPPFITSADIQLNDHAFGLLNSAVVAITIPNPDRDLAFVESIFARPGRAIRMKIAHPDSALANKTKLITPDPAPAGLQVLINETPKTMPGKPALNETTFEGILISFDYVYQSDGTVALTIYLRGKGDVIPDVSMYVPETKPKNNTTNEPEATSFYQELYNDVNSTISNKINPKIQTTPAYGIGGIVTGGKVNGKDYGIISFTDWNKNEQRYITLNYLINALNKLIVSKNDSISPNATIYCDDTICFSNKFEDIVSADPINIWLYQSDQYGTVSSDRPVQWSKSVKPIDTYGLLGPYQDADKAYPSRILLNLKLIETIYNSIKTNKDDFIVSKFLQQLSKYIFDATGGAVSMKLITYSDLMLYYDSNYLGDLHAITPYSVPMFANHINGSIVREFRIESKLPQNAQALMYTINQSSTISEEMIAPFMSFMYNNEIVSRDRTTNTDTISSGVDQKIVNDYKVKYKEFYEKYKKELADAKQKFNLTNNQSKITLETALKKYIQYPSPDIKKTAQMISPIYPVEVEFTIDGINGFKYGDALQFDALPPRYKINTTFSIISIVHTINNTGDWTTKIKCVMRPKLK